MINFWVLISKVTHLLLYKNPVRDHSLRRNLSIWEHLMKFQKVQVRTTLSQGQRGRTVCFQWAFGGKEVPTGGRVWVVENSTLWWWHCTGSGVLPLAIFRPFVVVVKQQFCHTNGRILPWLNEIYIKVQYHNSALAFNPSATQIVLQICNRNHFIQHRYAEVSRVESGSCSTHSLIEMLFTISICFAIVTHLCLQWKCLK